MKANQKRDGRLLRIEQLENRTLLAGDVSAAVIDGNLVLKGDAYSNGVQIAPGPAPDSFVVVGQPGSATEINGKLAPQTLTGVRYDVRVELGAGNDSVQIIDASLPGRLYIKLGNGADQIALDSVSVADRALIVGGNGNDLVKISNTTIDGDLAAHLGPGDDYFSVIGSHLGGLHVNAGVGANTVIVQNTIVDNNLAITNPARLAPSTITLDNVQVRLKLSVTTGGGDDNVSLDSVAADSIFVSLGEGDDTLTVDNSQAREAYFNGGPGTNLLYQEGNNFRSAVWKNFA